MGLVPPAGREAADDLLLRDHRDEQMGAHRDGAPDGLGQPWIVHPVGRHHRLPPPQGVLVEGVTADERDPDAAHVREMFGGDVIAGQRRHRLPVVLHQPHAGQVRAQAAHHVPEQLSCERLHVERRGQRLAHRQQGLRLLQLGRGLARQLRVLHAEADLGGHALQQAHLRIRELPPGLPPHQEQGADRLAAHGGGREQHRVRVETGHRLRVEARIRPGVRRPRGAAVAPALGERGESRQLERMGDEVLAQVRGHLMAGHRHQRVVLGIEGVDAGHVRPEGLSDLAGHQAHEILRGVRLRQGAADREQRGRLAQSLLHLRVEAGVGERQRELAGHRHGQIHLPRLERGGALGVIENHHPDDLVLPDQRHRHRGLDPEELHPGGRHQIARGRVGHDHRSAGGHRARVQRRIERQGQRHAPRLLGSLGIRPAVRELRHERHHPPVDPALDRAAIDPADLGDLDRHLPEQPLGVERGVQDLGDLEERAALLEPAPGLRVEARVADGHAGLGHEALQQLLVVGPELDRPAADQGEHAQQRILHQDRDREDAADPVRRRPRLEVEALILHDVGDLERPAVLGHPAHRALPEAQLPGRQVQSEIGGHGAQREGPVRLVGQPEVGERHRDQLGGRLRDRAQHLVHVERRRHDLGEPGQPAEARGAHVEGFVEPGVLERGGQLVGEDGQLLDLAVDEALAAPAVGDQRTPDVLADEGHGQDRPPADLADPAPRLRTEVHARIAQHVGGPHRPPLGQREPDHALVALQGLGRLGQRPGELAPAHREAQQLGVRILQPDGQVRKGERLAGLGGHQLQHAVLVERGHQDPTQLGDCAHALGLLGGLAIEPGVVDRDGGLAREGLGQLLLARGERAAAAEDEHADRPLAHEQRHAQEVGVAEPLARHLMVRDHVGPFQLAHQGLAGRQHLAAQALAHLQPGPRHGLGRGAGEPGHHQLVAVQQPEARVVQLE